jgi:Transglycosylase-like domain
VNRKRSGAPRDVRAVKDVIMRPTTTTALALAGTALALPAGVALAETNDDPPSPTDTALAAPFAGHLTITAQMRAERRELLVERLTPRIIRTERKTARVKGVEFSERAQKRRLHGASPKALRTELRKSRRELTRAKRVAAQAPASAGGTTTAAPHLQAIAACESGGNYSTNTGNGFYGAYQFTQSTWESVGGTGNPAAASPAEQDKRAAMLYAQQGSSPWPVCGQ